MDAATLDIAIRILLIVGGCYAWTLIAAGIIRASSELDEKESTKKHWREF